MYLFVVVSSFYMFYVLVTFNTVNTISGYSHELMRKEYTLRLDGYVEGCTGIYVHYLC